MKRDTGLWCTLCDKGPMASSLLVEQHLAARGHRKKMDACHAAEAARDNPSVVFKDGCAAELPKCYAMQGIIPSAGPAALPGKFYRCLLCGAGPFNTVEVIDQHLQSKRHQKAIAISGPVSVSNGADGAAVSVDPFTKGRWNLPDYVHERAGQLVCTLCDARANALRSMYMHLGGHGHARRCRGSDRCEIVYSQERRRLEERVTGLPVVRTGFQVPETMEQDCQCEENEEIEFVEEEVERDDTIEENEKEIPEASKPITTQSAVTNDGNICVSHGSGKALQTEFPDSSQSPKLDPTSLPEGWEEYFDEGSGCVYYCNGHMSQWEHPSTALIEDPKNFLCMKQKDHFDDKEHQVTLAAQPAVEVPAVVSPLPPGWRAVWHADTAAHYYADMEAQTTQWDPPQPYEHKDWTRRVDDAGNAFWASSELGMSFYEHEHIEGEWTRYTDQEGRAYWSNSTSCGLRFFEEFATVPIAVDARPGGA